MEPPSGSSDVLTVKITQHVELFFRTKQRTLQRKPTGPIKVNGVCRVPLVNGSSIRFSVSVSLTDLRHQTIALFCCHIKVCTSSLLHQFYRISKQDQQIQHSGTPDCLGGQISMVTLYLQTPRYHLIIFLAKCLFTNTAIQWPHNTGI